MQTSALLPAIHSVSLSLKAMSTHRVSIHSLLSTTVPMNKPSAPSELPMASEQAVADYFTGLALPRCGVDSDGEPLPDSVDHGVKELVEFVPPAGTRSPLSCDLFVMPYGKPCFDIILDYSRYPSLQPSPDFEPANLTLSYRCDSDLTLSYRRESGDFTSVHFSFFDPTPAGAEFDMIMADLRVILRTCPALRTRPLKYTPCIQMGNIGQPIELMRRAGIIDMSDA